MPVNNAIYSTEAAGWWNEDHFLHLLNTGVNPARLGYFQTVLSSQSFDPSGMSVLDAGCGGGILSEALARLGCRVTGIDLSAASLSVARRHALGQGLSIYYGQARIERLPFEAACFDAVFCCDVLEHLDDHVPVVMELARTLRQGGLFFYDTINRTEDSRRENIFAAQEFPLTRFFPPDTHRWEQFIRPEEMLGTMERAGLQNRDMTGLRSALTDGQVAALLVRRKLGMLSFAELGRRLRFRTGGGLEASYLGWAVKV